jgi:hypothetical protein
MMSSGSPGRNEPCPCGSGKKYKRCCALKTATREPRASAPPITHTSGSRLTSSGSGDDPLGGVELARNAATEAHARAVSAYHLDVLFEGVTVGDLDFKQVFVDCLAASETTVPGWKVPRRAHRALNLLRYFLKSLAVPGAHAECGVLKGFSALLMAKVARSRGAADREIDLHLVDSYEGLSAPTPKDAVQTAEQGNPYAAAKGDLAASLDHVQRVMKGIPGVAFHKGWIPEILETLPDTAWAFVHIDVDLYAPTRGCLEYFFPRLSPGGIIVNDDYASPLFPGGGRAWDEYCSRHNLAFAALDTGQAVLVKSL